MTVYSPDTKNKPYFWILTSKCDLHIGNTDLVLACDTQSPDGKTFLPNIFKTHQGMAKLWTEHETNTQLFTFDL